MRHALALAALASIVALGSALAPAGSWASLRPAPAPPMGERLYMLTVATPGRPGHADVADYGLTLGDCFEAMRAQPREAQAACELDRG